MIDGNPCATEETSDTCFSRLTHTTKTQQNSSTKRYHACVERGDATQHTLLLIRSNGALRKKLGTPPPKSLCAAFTRHLVIATQGQCQKLAEALRLNHALGAKNRRAYRIRERHDQVGVAPRPSLVLARPKDLVGGVHRQREDELEQEQRVVPQVVEGFQLVRAIVLILVKKKQSSGAGPRACADNL